MTNSIVAGRYKSIDAKNPRRAYQKPSIITQGIINHRNGHSIRPNRVLLKYLDFKKDVDLNVHVRMFNSIVKANAKTSKSISSTCLAIC